MFILYMFIIYAILISPLFLYSTFRIYFAVVMVCSKHEDKDEGSKVLE